MKLNRVGGLALAALVVLRAGVCLAAQTQALSGHVPAAIRALSPVGGLPATNRLALAIALPLRNRPALTHLLGEITDPASPRYRQFLSADEFAERFGPTEKDYAALQAFALAKGLTLRGTHPNRTLLDVEGTVGTVESAFQVKLQLYRHPRENRMFYAPDRERALDLGVPVLHVSGLDNYSRPRPNLHLQTSSLMKLAGTNGGASPNSSYRGNDFRKAYAPGVSLTGAGQSVGLVEFDGYYANDISLYESYTGLSSVTLTNVLLDGFDGTPSVYAYIVEVSLDIEMAIAMAPGLSRVFVYEAGTNGLPNDVLNRMATDNLAKQLSCSWSWDPPDASTDQIFLQFAAQGQSFFCASGDTDAYAGPISAPCDSPFITSVGGTVLSTGSNGVWASESAWNWNNNQGSSGGISTLYGLPSWQQGLNMATNHGSTKMRNIPDVALTGDYVWVVFDGGYAGDVSGTSCAAPLWAGFMAMVNQQASANGRPVVGFANPALYALGKGAGYTNLFHDTITGSNTNSASPTNFFAVPGYDLCTGWGTPNGSNLIQALAVPDTLLISPAAALMATGVIGGALSPACLSYSLTNQAASPASWSLTNVGNWLTLSPGGGRLGPGAGTNVGVCINSNAAFLPAGLYEDTLTFSNWTTGVSQARTVDLVIEPANDQCAGAFVILGVNSTNTQSTATATSSGDPSPDCFKTFGKGVWYQYTPNFNGFVWVDTIGSDFDTALALYSGTCGALSLLACDDDSGGNYTSSLTNQVAAGTTYFILAGGYAAASGNLILHVRGVNGVVPSITEQPADQTATEGGTAAFNVAASGSTPLSYYWWWNGVPVAGANGPGYTTPALKLSDSGSQVGCLVSNAFGMTNTRGAVLHVFSLPRPFVNTNAITINDFSPATPYPAIISVSAQTGTVATVTATLHGLAHTFPEDIDILLVGPQGQQALLMAHAGSGQPIANILLTFDDRATNALTSEDPISSGIFKPGNEGLTNSFPLPAPPRPYGTNLGVFYGTKPNGDWSLYVLDDTASDSGCITGGWSLNLSLEPVSTAPMFVPGSLKSLRNGQFQFAISGDYGANYELLVSTDLTHWKTLKTLSMTNDVSVFVDTNTNLARRFYRTRFVRGE